MNTTQQEVSPRQDRAATPEETPRARRGRSPRVDVSETPEAFHVTAEVPGVPMEAIEVTAEENRLEIFARRDAVAHEGFHPAFRQYGDGDYRRAFNMPEAIERTEIRAELRDGILRITLPKAQPVTPQKVRVSVG